MKPPARILGLFTVLLGAACAGPSLQPVLTEVINELKPKKIGINESVTIPICDGLSV